MIRTVAETESTNDDLAALAREGEPEGVWLRAERQTGGKGRQGRTWLSPPGNLYASTIVRLRPGDPPAPTLALVAAVALHEAVSPVAPATLIKWPNDLLVGRAKLAGILLERVEEAVIAGFGVNIAHHPTGLARETTSLAVLEASCPPPGAMAATLAAAFARWLDHWRSAGLEPVRAAWLACAHPVGTLLSTADGDGRFEGLDAQGALLLRRAEGDIRSISAGDVFLL